MGTSGLLVLDDVQDVGLVFRELVVSGTGGEEQQIVEAFSDDVHRIERGGDFYPDDAGEGRLYIEMLCNYWYPGELHYSPGNWEAVSRLGRKLWQIDPALTLHYMPEYQGSGGDTSADVIAKAHGLTEGRVAELDIESARELRAREVRNRIGQHGTVRADGYGLDI